MSRQVTTKTTAGRIEKKFAELRARDEAALIPFIVAGDPNLEATRALVLELEARGADLVELGVPFSDPMADGPANQRALARGLASGASLAAILAMVSEVRRQTQIPIVLFGYYNPILHYGCERLCADAARAGVDGLLVVDLPPEEAAELARPARAARPRPHLSARADHAGRARTHDRAHGQRLSLLCRGDRRDRRAHQPRRRARDRACATCAR